MIGKKGIESMNKAELKRSLLRRYKHGIVDRDETITMMLWLRSTSNATIDCLLQELEKKLILYNYLEEGELKERVKEQLCDEYVRQYMFSEFTYNVANRRRTNEVRRDNF